MNGRCALPEVQFGQHPGADHQESAALPLSGMPEGLLSQDGHSYAQLALGLPEEQARVQGTRVLKRAYDNRGDVQAVRFSADEYGLPVTMAFLGGMT